MTNMTNDERPRAYTVRDKDREIQFIGTKIGASSSFRDGSDRWIELAIFRTAGGQFVVSGTGKTTVPGEVDRFWAQVSEQPQGVIERLYLIDDNGTRYLPHTSRNALKQAAERDETFKEAFAVEYID